MNSMKLNSNRIHTVPRIGVIVKKSTQGGKFNENESVFADVKRHNKFVKKLMSLKD